MCSSSKDDSDEERSRFVEIIRDGVRMRNAKNPSAAKIQAYLQGHAIKDISPQFIENVNNVLEKYQNNNFVLLQLTRIVSELI